MAVESVVVCVPMAYDKRRPEARDTGAQAWSHRRTVDGEGMYWRVNTVIGKVLYCTTVARPLPPSVRSRRMWM